MRHVVSIRADVPLSRSLDGPTVPQQAPSPSTCFPMDTLIHTTDGYCTEIQYIGVGMKVLSRCEKTGELAYKRVMRVFKHTAEELGLPGIPLVRVKFRLPAGREEIGNWVLPAPNYVAGIKVTPEHPFWVNGVGWVKAGQLQTGHQLELIDPVGMDDVSRPEGQKTKDMVTSGRRWLAEVVSVEPVRSSYGGAQFVYNFEVEDFHTYFVESFGVWVHNKNPDGLNNPGVPGQS